ncbi:MAG: hypothetical protein ACKV2T_06360, partial [Kofleriaceae bacterium]
IGGNERFHAWTFELSGDAKVDMTTSYSVLGQRRTDTVLYLYKQKPDGKWGSYIARNDDYNTTVYSQLKKNLGVGNYRVLVKGHAAATTGKFKIAVSCTGDGCEQPEPPPDTSTCVFGSTYREIFDSNPHLQVINSNKIYPNTLATLNPVDRQRLMLAVQQSSHTDVTTPEEAILRVDQEEVNVTWIAEPEAQRMFIAFEYGAGDNSYGAVFESWSGEMVTNIHDGDLEGCATPPADCLFPDDWNGLKFSTAFTRTATRTVTQASQLAGVSAQQALLTFTTVFGETIQTVEQGIQMADRDEINVHTYKNIATNKSFDVFEFGAGDTSVGQLFYAGTTTHAAEISDLQIQNCTFFAP